jgi:type II secretory pathway component PulL
MPDGVLVNAEQQLLTQLARREGSSGEGVLVLLSELAPLLVSQAGMVITRLDYNAPRQELQLSLSAQRNGDILAFADAVQALGLDAQAQGFSRQGDAQLANVLIKESSR